MIARKKNDDFQPWESRFGFARSLKKVALLHIFCIYIYIYFFFWL